MSNMHPLLFIVDDEPLLSEMLTDYLLSQNPDFQIKSFPTGEACLGNLSEEPDAIILDYHLNSKEKQAANGIDILREIKQRNRSLPVIMLSSQESYGTAAKTIMYGAVHYVIKGAGAFDDIFQLVNANV